jgi:hypothetical protein
MSGALENIVYDMALSPELKSHPNTRNSSKADDRLHIKRFLDASTFRTRRSNHIYLNDRIYKATPGSRLPDLGLIDFGVIKHVSASLSASVPPASESSAI